MQTDLSDFFSWEYVTLNNFFLENYCLFARKIEKIFLWGKLINDSQTQITLNYEKRMKI